jgi:hypothetical protein
MLDQDKTIKKEAGVPKIKNKLKEGGNQFPSSGIRTWVTGWVQSDLPASARWV